MNRRRFLHTAGVLSVMAALPRRAAAASERIKIGFLGATHSHAFEKFKVLKALPEFEVLGLVEESAVVPERFTKLDAQFLSREELLARAEIVVVESAVRDHARDAKAALSAGKHVHVEKPPASTLAEMLELVRLAQAKQRLLQVGYMWRHNPGFNKALEAAREGWLGEVYLVRATMNSFIDDARRPEWAEFEGGAMFELGCHLLDAVTRLLGKPTRVTPHLQRRGGDKLADNCVAVLEYPKAQAIITSAVLQPNAGTHRFLEILGTNGTLKIQPIEPPEMTIELAKPAGPYKAGAQKIALPSYQRYHGEFVELSRALNTRTPLPVSPAEELEIQEVLLRACGMV